MILVFIISFITFLHIPGADPEICVRGPVPLLPLLSSSPLPLLPSALEVGPLNQLEGLGAL